MFKHIKENQTSSALKVSFMGGKKKKVLTAILSSFVEPQEHIADFQPLLCKLQQTGKAAAQKETRQ